VFGNRWKGETEAERFLRLSGAVSLLTVLVLFFAPIMISLLTTGAPYNKVTNTIIPYSLYLLILLAYGIMAGSIAYFRRQARDE
jgi:peptidoglycan biosynthesis protein MviN/MurJ (putative lipid II flippase)